MATQSAAASRKKTKETAKFYDEQNVNGWNLKYEYESINQAKPTEIKVTGEKQSASVFITKSTNNTSVNFGGSSEIDADIIAIVKTELTAIEAGFES